MDLLDIIVLCLLAYILFEFLYVAFCDKSKIQLEAKIEKCGNQFICYVVRTKFFGFPIATLLYTKDGNVVIFDKKDELIEYISSLSKDKNE